MASRTVFITGTSAGLGRATAEHLAGAGWQVLGAARRSLGGSGWDSLEMDVCDDASVEAGVAEAISRLGQLDAVVLAAGWGLAGPVESTPIDLAQAQLDTNFFGVARVAKAALPALRASRGRLVVVGSIGGVVGLPYQAYYSASKFALEGFVEALAYEVAPFGVQVSIVEPGNFATEFTTARHTVDGGADDPYAAAARKAISTMERDEVAGVAPAVAAKAIARILDARRAPRRCSIGRLDERAGLLGKRLLPSRLFEAAARSSLGV